MEKLPQLPGIHYVSGPKEVGTFTLSLPGDIDAGSALPLVVSLHYAGSGVRYYGAGLLGDVVEPALSKLEAVLVAPDCQAGLWHNVESESQVLALIKLIQDSYRIDPTRILITGYSIGGIGTWFIASRHQGLFSAAVPMAAKPPSGVEETEWQIPLFVLHGERDELFPLAETVQTVEELRRAGAEVDLQVVEGATHYQTGRFYRPLRQLVPKIATLWSATRQPP